MKEKHSYISKNKEKNFINESKIHRKKWKARMFLENGSYFDDIRLNSSNCFELKGNFSAYDDRINEETFNIKNNSLVCLLYTSPSPRDYAASRMPSSA